MSAKDFLPEVWEFHPDDSNSGFLFLVCGRRWWHGDPVAIGADSKTGKPHNRVNHPELEGEQGEGTRWDWIAHPVAIRLGFLPVEIFYGFRQPGEWFLHPVSDFKLSKESAIRALRHAYRTVSVKHDVGASTVKVVAKPGVLRAKGRSAYWKITAHVCWPAWDQEKLSLSERATRLCEMGFDVGTQALRDEIKRT